tara:strand:- start:414 stop:1760 length:1347 start_codon:yes stop_codon:yes gene_type:complete
MRIAGISEGSHDAAYCLLDNKEILYASHSERYSQVKNDSRIHRDMVRKSDVICYYEKPFWKNTRRLYAGQSWKLTQTKYDESFSHHKSHAAAGFYTSPFHNANILVVDAIGEWDTTSIWYGDQGSLKTYRTLKKIYSRKYPWSLGLLYSAVTQLLGFKPNEEEYIVMGMAAYGEPKHKTMLKRKLDSENLHWGLNIKFDGKPEDLAASVQSVYEDELLKLVEKCPEKNLVIMGGCALNCVANSKIKGKNIWIMPSPGDAGSSLGAAALMFQRKLKWKSPYLGYKIDREINPKIVVNHLLKHKMCGIANGKAEFGPRALGNRSLIADPRLPIKDTMNEVKQRQKFRPFAPSILEEHAEEYFEGPMNRYMNFVAKAKHDHKSVTHVDGTARVQLVEKDCESIIRPILEEWYERTGCPMLLNTSLNIKGKPIVNTWEHANDFQKNTKVKVF